MKANQNEIELQPKDVIPPNATDALIFAAFTGRFVAKTKANKKERNVNHEDVTPDVDGARKQTESENENELPTKSNGESNKKTLSTKTNTGIIIAAFELRLILSNHINSLLLIENHLIVELFLKIKNNSFFVKTAESGKFFNNMSILRMNNMVI